MKNKKLRGRHHIYINAFHDEARGYTISGCKGNQEIMRELQTVSRIVQKKLRRTR
jgi:hypothetical protein